MMSKIVKAATTGSKWRSWIKIGSSPLFMNDYLLLKDLTGIFFGTAIRKVKL